LLLRLADFTYTVFEGVISPVPLESEISSGTGDKQVVLEGILP
jgi:hypothetical protein